MFGKINPDGKFEELNMKITTSKTLSKTLATTAIKLFRGTNTTTRGTNTNYSSDYYDTHLQHRILDRPIFAELFPNKY